MHFILYSSRSEIQFELEAEKNTRFRSNPWIISVIICYYTFSPMMISFLETSLKLKHTRAFVLFGSELKEEESSKKMKWKYYDVENMAQFRRSIFPQTTTTCRWGGFAIYSKGWVVRNGIISMSTMFVAIFSHNRRTLYNRVIFLAIYISI